MAYESILVERDGSVAVITLNRPKALNALNESVLRELGQAMAELEADRQVLAVVITGSGEKAFAAGADIGELSRLPDAGKSLVLVFEGPDAAGKGGTIRRLTSAMDAGVWENVSVAAPTGLSPARRSPGDTGPDYLVRGAYAVLVQVCDDDGGCATATATYTIANAPPHVAAGTAQGLQEGGKELRRGRAEIARLQEALVALEVAHQAAGFLDRRGKGEKRYGLRGLTAASHVAC